jgi:hypothetical protein
MCCSAIINFQVTENAFAEIRTDSSFGGGELWPCFCVLFAKINNLGLGTGFYLAQFPKLSSPGLELRKLFWSFDLS